MIGLRNRRRVGMLIWMIGAVVAVLWSGFSQQQKHAVPGWGHPTNLQIASEVDGRIASLNVVLHDSVDAGQAVMQMSDVQERLEREVAAAEFLAISEAPSFEPEAQIERARDVARSRQLQTDFAVLEGRIRSLRQLLQNGAASQGELDQALAKRRVLQLKLERAAPDAPAPQTNPWSVIAALRRLDRAEARVDALVVRSAIGGRVSVVHRRAGEVVRRGEPVLTVEQPTSSEVIAWVTPRQVLTVGMPAVVQRSDGTKLKAEVVSVAAGPAVLPEQIWTIPGRPQYGIGVRVKLEDATVRPREPVRVFL